MIGTYTRKTHSKSIKFDGKNIKEIEEFVGDLGKVIYPVIISDKSMLLIKTEKEDLYVFQQNTIIKDDDLERLRLLKKIRQG